MSLQTYPILLVEDDPSLRQSLQGFFEDNGYQTHVAASRLQGQELLRSLGRAICLLDLNLPDGSGLDLLRLIVRENLPIRVIIMSALPQARLRQQFPPAVLVALMTKPVSPQELLDVVNQITLQEQIPP